MKQCVIYYDDSKSSCRAYAELLSSYQEITCKKASDYVKRIGIVEESPSVGFVFESDKEKVPYAIRHVIWKGIMNKKGFYFLVVTGGTQEFFALRSAVHELEERGCSISNVYSKYMFEKGRLSLLESVKEIVEDIEKQEADYPKIRNQFSSMNKKELRKALWEEIRKYNRYRKKVVNEVGF